MVNALAGNWPTAVSSTVIERIIVVLDHRRTVSGNLLCDLGA